MNSWPGIKFCILAALVFLALARPAAAVDALNLGGEPLSEAEMAEAQGGFTLPNGDFLYFSMDFMRVNLVSHQQPGGADINGFVNSLRQEAVIGKDGSIQVNVDILQAGQGDGIGQNGGTPQQINAVLLNNSFTNFQGLANANLITGNHNVGSIINVINLRLGFFSKENFSAPDLRDFFMH
ncbi:hypothetical protein [Geoalkalibacter halelectricus]|uniref:Uncharacterized protein n=1 Tax=Geoalkalibacter halelectricus TaxID=2847045 RepID=A0ABY5ZIR1_9BACT|nr:hypothetical protein [Geoalkalibacter halelectricus]MDO3378956.1 hypothetical protein [Geoalkalibacter halelectricus]UWZ79021.1 hypothetical protein L9S41_15250 [Geoalkalibacter halelectricus]